MEFFTCLLAAVQRLYRDINICTTVSLDGKIGLGKSGDIYCTVGYGTVGTVKCVSSATVLFLLHFFSKKFFFLRGHILIQKVVWHLVLVVPTIKHGGLGPLVPIFF